jgi:hypothetical protein
MANDIHPKSLLDTDIVDAFFQQGKDVQQINRHFEKAAFPDYNRPVLRSIKVVTQNREEWLLHHSQQPQVFKRTDAHHLSFADSGFSQLD